MIVYFELHNVYYKDHEVLSLDGYIVDTEENRKKLVDMSNISYDDLDAEDLNEVDLFVNKINNSLSIPLTPIDIEDPTEAVIKIHSKEQRVAKLDMQANFILKEKENLLNDKVKLFNLGG